MLVYKIAVLDALKEKGYNTGKLRKGRLLSEATIQALREGKPISWASLDTVCDLLNCQPGSVIEHKRESKGA